MNATAIVDLTQCLIPTDSCCLALAYFFFCIFVQGGADVSHVVLPQGNEAFVMSSFSLVQKTALV